MAIVDVGAGVKTCENDGRGNEVEGRICVEGGVGVVDCLGVDEVELI